MRGRRRRRRKKRRLARRGGGAWGKRDAGWDQNEGEEEAEIKADPLGRLRTRMHAINAVVVDACMLLLMISRCRCC